MKHKKYILFAFSEYYPSGGMGDLVGSYDTPEGAVAEYMAGCFEDCQIIDRDTWEEINFAEHVKK